MLSYVRMHATYSSLYSVRAKILSYDGRECFGQGDSDRVWGHIIRFFLCSYIKGNPTQRIIRLTHRYRSLSFLYNTYIRMYMHAWTRLLSSYFLLHSTGAIKLYVDI